MKKITLFLFLLVAISACYYDRLEEITPNTTSNGNNANTCDTSLAITYTATIKPILTKYCTGCHTGSTAGGGISLVSYEDAKTADKFGKLFGSVSWNGTASNMPKGGNKLSDCNIELIKKWAANNYAQ